MLTFDNRFYGKPIAIVKGGKMNNKILFLVPDQKTPEIFKSDSKDSGNYIHVPDGVFEIIPSEWNRCSHTAGCSGSGKSTICAKYVRNHLVKYDSEFILISQKSHDEVLDKLKPNRIVLDESLVEDPINIDEIPDNSIVVFDDCDTLHDKQIQKAINTLKEQLMEIGRARNIFVYSIQHLINGKDRNAGRTIMNEVQSLTVFPGSGSKKPIQYCLATYFGLDKYEIKKILDINSRWVTLITEAPQIILSEHMACLLKDL